MSNAPQARSTEPLPKQVDIRRLITAGGTISAKEPLASFQRLHGMVESDEGDVDIALDFFIDEQKLRRIDGKIRTTVQVLCQRCLQPMPVEIDSGFAVAAVWADDDADKLPRHVDAYVVGEEPQDLRELIEDELIVSLPYISYHETGPCADQIQKDDSAAVKPERGDPGNENPFSVLEQLKSGK